MFFTQTVKYTTLLIIFTLSVLLSSGQGQLDSMQHIKEIVVAGNIYREIIPSQRLSGQQLQHLNSHTVADALRYFSGIQLKDYGGVGGLKTVNIRSMGSQHVGVFYDGIKLGNAQNGTIDLGKFSLDNLEEITLYNGQKSEIFQPARDFGAAGSIYLKSKKPHFQNGKKNKITIKYKTGSINLHNPSFRWEQKINKNINSSLSAGYTVSDGKYKFRYKRIYPNGKTAYDTTATRQNGDITALRIEGGLYGRGIDYLWESKLYYYNSERGLPGPIVNNKFNYGQRLWDKNFFIQNSFFKDITEKYKIQIRGKYAKDHTRYLDADTITLHVDNTYNQQELYLSLANLYNISKIWDISLSSDFQWNKLDANLINFSYPQRYSFLISCASALNLGSLKLQASLLGTFIKEDVKKNVSAPDKAEYTPAIFFNFKPLSQQELYLRAFYKQIFRMPTFNDLYYTNIGNSLLLPEYTSQYNLGISYKKECAHNFTQSFNCQADIYYIAVKNKIIAAPTGSLFRWMMMNLGKVEIRGIDIAANMNNTINQIRINTGITYTYQEAQDFSDSSTSFYGHQIPYIPWHNGTLVINSFYKTWNLNYSFIYTGERYDGNKNNIQYNYIQPWYTHDLSLQKYFNRKQTKYKISFEANNLLNQYYDVVLNYPMPGRNFRLIVDIML